MTLVCRTDDKSGNIETKTSTRSNLIDANIKIKKFTVWLALFLHWYFQF